METSIGKLLLGELNASLPVCRGLAAPQLFGPQTANSVESYCSFFCNSHAVINCLVHILMVHLALHIVALFCVIIEICLH